MEIEPVLKAINDSKLALEQRANSRWIVGFSGGKDSTASLKILLSAWKLAKSRPSQFDVIYCDTGVENPILDKYIKRLFLHLKAEAKASSLPINPVILRSPPQDRFFVRIIGRGYPPPTNSFRWCTKSLRINPVTKFLSEVEGDAVVALGLRNDESQQRNRSMASGDGSQWQKQRESTSNHDIFLPVMHLGVEEVWDAVFGLSSPKSINPRELQDLYRDASGECPIIKAPNAAPCGSGRFGCWTCTVVRKDKSAMKLIEADHTSLVPYLHLRNWLSEYRNDPNNRLPRRNGSPGHGPFTMNARKEILRRVDDLESLTRTEILDHEERGTIAALWKFDEVAKLSFKI